MAVFPLHYSGKRAKEVEWIKTVCIHNHMAASLEGYIELEVPRHLQDKRVDSVLTTLLGEKFPERGIFSRSLVTRLIKSGVVLLNNQAVLSRALVSTHDKIAFPESIFEKPASSEAFSRDISVKVLFENDHFLILDKGASVQMHQAGNYRGSTVAGWILEHYPDLASVGEDSLRPGIVHRLDRETSGILIVAKTNETFQELKQAFQDRMVQKTYLALAYGHLSSRVGEVTASLIRHPGELKRRAVDPETYTGVLPGNTRTAFTSYRVVARYDKYDLVELTPKTGRTHQLRVHLAYLGHPVVGDKLYAFKEVRRQNLLSPARHLLHAHRLSFTLFGEHYHFQSPLPNDFKKIQRSLDETLVSSYDDEALKSLF